VSVDKNIMRATYRVDIDRLTEEYTAEYNCADKTEHITKVTIKEGNNIIEEKKLYINEKVIRGTIDSDLLDTVCSLQSSIIYPDRR
jgi:hypothetical protein